MKYTIDSYDSKRSYPLEKIKSFKNSNLGIVINVDPDIINEELIVIASEKFQNLFEIDVSNSELTIGVGNGVIKIQNIVLNLKSLEQIVQTGMGDLKGFINTKNLLIIKDGIGGVKLKGNVDTLKIKKSGIGYLDTSELLAQEIFLTSSGIGSIKCSARKIKSGDISGIGSISYYSDNAYDFTINGLGSATYLGPIRESTHTVDSAYTTSQKVKEDIIKSVEEQSNYDSIEYTKKKMPSNNKIEENSDSISQKIKNRL